MLDLIDIPDFGIDIIWGQLTVKEQFIFRLVCKTWRLLANRLFFQALTISDASPQLMDFLPRYGSIIYRLSISELDVSLAKIEKTCENLVSLSLKRVSFDGVSAKEKPLKHLTFLSITLEGVFSSEKDLITWSPLMSGLTNLSTLILNEFDPIVAQTLFYSLPLLSAFRYTSAGPLLPKAWKPKHLLKLKENLDLDKKQSFVNRNLRKLYIESYLPLKVDTDFILFTPSNFPRLSKLTLRLFDGLLDDWQESAWPDLYHLHSQL
ncbi:hypothetical protein DSO57_1014695 [Entomophthora muscae]|uniref:Uncharacterized protein n=1 Tax=Entomophthora muscae TaxID=34485 RepID=A0ACC2T5E9_9FUNG|nr:hypothetical protein DSO57_1014695 [Entomophthora muscae]